MKHARKMVLVPSDTFKPDPFPHPLAQAVSELDNLMDQILKRNDLDDASKWRLYEQALSRHRNLYKIATSPKEIEIAPSLPSLNRDWIDDLPVAYYQKAQTMVDQLETVPERIRWDQNGELVVDGRHIKGSNIGDIAQAYLKPTTYPKPIGYFPFISKLTLLNSSPPIPGFPQPPTKPKSNPPPKKNVRGRPVKRTAARKRASSSSSSPPYHSPLPPPSKSTRSHTFRGKGKKAAWVKLY